MDYMKCMKRIQKTIGDIKAGDGIKEPLWYVEMGEELRLISKELAKELQTEMKVEWNKVGYTQTFDEAPPMRLPFSCTSYYSLVRMDIA